MRCLSNSWELGVMNQNNVIGIRQQMTAIQLIKLQFLRIQYR